MTEENLLIRPQFFIDFSIGKLQSGWVTDYPVLAVPRACLVEKPLSPNVTAFALGATS